MVGADRHEVQRCVMCRETCLLAQMKKRGIETHLGAKPIRIEADKVITEREEIPADLVLMMLGLTGPLWLDNTELPRSSGGFAAVANILNVIKGEAPSHNFKAELICIVDTLDTGIVVYRSEKQSVFLPTSKLRHWAKRAFEGLYLKAYRK